jgi:hypothetical protein
LVLLVHKTVSNLDATTELITFSGNSFRHMPC